MSYHKFAVAISLSKKSIQDFDFLGINPEYFVREVMRRVISGFSNIKKLDDDLYDCFILNYYNQDVLLFDYASNGKTFLRALDHFHDINMIVPVNNISPRDRELIMSVLSARKTMLFSFELPRFDNLLYFHHLKDSNSDTYNDRSYFNEVALAIITSVAADLITEFIKELIQSFAQ